MDRGTIRGSKVTMGSYITYCGYGLAAEHVVGNTEVQGVGSRVAKYRGDLFCTVLHFCGTLPTPRDFSSSIVWY